MNFVIITENDNSEWKDETGISYHFPKRYLKYLQPGTHIIYYKGKLREKSFETKRLSSEPHYFGMGTISEITKDPKSSKEDYFAKISEFILFPVGVEFKKGGKLFETIPQNRESNYWRDGVRPITIEIYNSILEAAGIDKNNNSVYNDLSLNESGFINEFEEGGVSYKYSTVYERNPAIRKRALEIHGYSCKGCGFNFKNFYGDWGQGFIHVHHTKPVSSMQEKTNIDVNLDLTVLCANCHSMVHRKRDKILSIEELQELIKRNAP